MYLLATDFDRTFYINNNDFKRNLENVEKFMKNNLFVIATGRSYQDFNSITKGSVKCHYLVINHGATILKGDKVIKNFPIEDEVIYKLKQVIDFDNLDYFACSEKESRVDINVKGVTKINISFPDNLVAKKAVDYINKNFKSVKAYVLFHKNQMEIISSKVDKKNAIEYIREIENIDCTDVYTAGDGYTDFEMVKNYNGYAMKISVDELKEVACKVIDSVSEIIEYIDVTFKYLSNKEEATKFINKCFNHQNYFEKYMAKIYGSEVDKTNYHLGLFKEDILIGTALLIPNELRMGDSKLSVLTIGSICVDKKYRKQGYFHLLMNEIEKETKKYDVNVLSGNKELYKKYGYYPNLINVYKVGAKDNNFEFKKMDGSLDQECFDLYDKNIVKLTRDKELFTEIATQWRGNAYYIYKDNEFLGYLIYNTKLDYVCEININNADITKVLESFALVLDREYVNISVLNNNYELLDKLSSFNSNKMYNRQLYKINNLKKVIQICLEYKLKYGNLEKGCLSLKIDEEIIKITIDDKVRVEESNEYDLSLDYDQAMDILLNKKISNNKLLNSWFYLDLDIYNNDLV